MFPLEYYSCTIYECKMERVSTEEMHARHAETLHQYFPMKTPTQRVYVSLHQHFSNKPASNISPDFSVEGNWMSKCQSCRQDSLQYADFEHTTIADRALNWSNMMYGNCCYFPRKLLSREYNMSLWKAGSVWAEMDGLPEARTIS